MISSIHLLPNQCICRSSCTRIFSSADPSCAFARSFSIFGTPNDRRIPIVANVIAIKPGPLCARSVIHRDRLSGQYPAVCFFSLPTGKAPPIFKSTALTTDHRVGFGLLSESQLHSTIGHLHLGEQVCVCLSLFRRATRRKVLGLVSDHFRPLPASVPTNKFIPAIQNAIASLRHGFKALDRCWQGGNNFWILWFSSQSPPQHQQFVVRFFANASDQSSCRS